MWGECCSEPNSISRLSDGAFDVTVGPLTKLWRRARRTHKLPVAERLRQARDAVGFQFLTLQAEELSVQMMIPGMLLDLGGIAKGYALDIALQTLVEHGWIECCWMAAETCWPGNHRRDAAAGRSAWPTWRDVRTPLLDATGRQSRATSGDLFQFVEIDGSAILIWWIPRTGLGLVQRSSVTVVAADATAADALASAVSVLGPERGLRLIESLPAAQARVAVIREWSTCRPIKPLAFRRLASAGQVPTRLPT